MSQTPRPTRLVYQPVPARQADDAFEAAAHHIAQTSAALALVSPYLSVQVVAPLVHARPFRLITDVEECLSAAGEDASLLRFLHEHRDQVRTIRGVHAKVILGDHEGLLGSANLTRQGFCQRFEMACRIHDAELQEAHGWFERLWQEASPLSATLWTEHDARLEARGKASRQDEPQAPARSALSTTGCLRRSGGPGAHQPGDSPRVAWPQRALTPAVCEADLQEFAQALQRLSPRPQVARAGLAMMRRALLAMDRPAQDPALHLNFRGHRAPFIRVTLGQRDVIVMTSHGQTRHLTLIMDDPELAKQHAARREGVQWEVFTKQRRVEAALLYWPLEAIGELPQELDQSWQRGILQEMERLRPEAKSGYSRAKRPALYRLIMEDSPRERALGLAYPGRLEDEGRRDG